MELENNMDTTENQEVNTEQDNAQSDSAPVEESTAATSQEEPLTSAAQQKLARVVAKERERVKSKAEQERSRLAEENAQLRAQLNQGYQPSANAYNQTSGPNSQSEYIFDQATGQHVPINSAAGELVLRDMRIREHQAQQAQMAQQEQLNHARLNFSAKIEEANKNDPNFGVCFEKVDQQLGHNPVVQATLWNMPDADKVIGFLGSNPDELARIQSISNPHRLVAELGKLEERAKPMKRMVPQGTDPISPVNPSANVTAAYSDPNMDLRDRKAAIKIRQQG